jgi:hypothetical protein
LFQAVSAAGARRQEGTLLVHDDGPVGLDRVGVEFDDERVVSDAGIALLATLAGRLGVERLVERFVRLRRDRPGAQNGGRKVMALVYAMALGAYSIDDCELLRSGRTRRLLGGFMPAPSTLDTFPRAFTSGHVRQLDRVLAAALDRAWAAGAGPGAERLVIDVDSFVGECTATASRAPASATRAGAATTRCSPSARTPARSCMCGCARARRTPPAARCASSAR